MRAVFVHLVCLFTAVAVAAGQSESNPLDRLFTRQLKEEPSPIVDCIPKEKGCPIGEYCVYFPTKKCMIQKGECRTEQVQECAIFGIYFETYDPAAAFSDDKVKETSCVEYKNVEKEVCDEDTEVCYEFACAKLAPGYT